MKGTSALTSGLAGAVALTIVHETIKRISPNAPRMDLLGMNALTKILRSSGQTPPGRRKLFLYTMAGDIITNALYYSLTGVGSKRNALIKGVLLGTAAGIGGILLPKPMGLNPRHSSRTGETKLLTVGIYLLGGLVASSVIKLFRR